MSSKLCWFFPMFIIGTLVSSIALANDISTGLIMLGDEEYHARANLDETHHVLSIRLLDKTGKKPIAIEAPSLLVNLKVDNSPRQYHLSPVSMAADPDGQSSRFALQNEELVGLLHRQDSGAHFRVTINGKSYRGNLNFSGHQH